MPLLDVEPADATWVPNITRAVANAPDLQELWTPLANHLLFRQSLPKRERELVILRVAWRTASPYEWSGHVRLAHRAGLSDDEITQVTTLAGWSDLDAALLGAVDELYEDDEISNSTWAQLSARLSTEQLVELIFTIGQYVTVAWFVNSVGLPLDAVPNDAR